MEEFTNHVASQPDALAVMGRTAGSGPTDVTSEHFVFRLSEFG